jgi:hypothetical protein
VTVATPSRLPPLLPSEAAEVAADVAELDALVAVAVAVAAKGRRIARMSEAAMFDGWTG